MAEMNLSKFKSIRIFNEEINVTHVLIEALNAQIFATKTFFDGLKVDRSAPQYIKLKHLIEVDSVQMEKIYELGFIALFANFESFTFNLLKELYKKYPSSCSSERLIAFEDIKGFETVQQIRDYFIDCLAIKNSYDTEQWVKYLQLKFKVKVFKNKKQFNSFRALNALRNIILHSGGKTNSKFRKDLSMLKIKNVPIDKPVTSGRKNYFKSAHSLFTSLINNLNSC